MIKNELSLIQPIQIMPDFPYCSFSVLGSISESHIVLVITSFFFFLVFFGRVSVPYGSDILKNTGQLFCRKSLNLICLLFTNDFTEIIHF